MASANTNQNSANDKLVILRGDDTGGAFGRTLYITIEAAPGVSLDGCKAEWIFDGITKTLDAPLVPGEVREIFYSHNETRCMSLGVRYGTFRIIDAAGKVRTLTNTKAVEVTDNVARCYLGASSASFVVVGVGDMKHSEFADLQEKEGMTLKEVGSMVNTLVRKLKGTVAAFVALLAFSALAAAPLSPDTDFGDIDPFAKLKTVVEASGAISGVDTNAVRDIIREQLATNGIRSVDGAARPLPKYLHALDFDDSYPDAAEEYYRSRGNGKTDGGCSSVRDGGFLYRNFDYPFDDRAEFVVRVSGNADGRFASVGVAQVGTNLTEQIVTSGKPEYSHLYKWLPGATVDGINENGVACNINVVDGDPQTSGWHNDTGDLHPLAAVRWILDNATNALHAATYIASHIAFPPGWAQNYHYMIADATSTYIVENGTAYSVPPPSSAAGTVPPPSSAAGAIAALTNFRLYPTPSDGEGQERYIALTNGANITSQWWTLTYTPTGYRPSDLPGITGQSLTDLFNYWASKPRESHRGETFGGEPWWQSIHTSVYDLTNRVLRVAVQETDDWYVFAVPSAGGTDEAKVREIAEDVASGKLDKSDPVLAPTAPSTFAPETALAGARATGDALEDLRQGVSVAQSAADEASEVAGGAAVIAEEAKSLAMSNAGVIGNLINGKMEKAFPSRPEETHIAVLTLDGNVKESGLTTDDITGKLDAPAASAVTEDHVALFHKSGGTVTIKDGGSLPQDYAAVSNAAVNARSKLDMNAYERKFDFSELAGIVGCPEEYFTAEVAYTEDWSASYWVIMLDESVPYSFHEWATIERYPVGPYVEDAEFATIENRARDPLRNKVVMHNKVGQVYGRLAVENANALSAMLDDASTNQTARASTGAKMMALIEQPVSQKINNAVSANLNTYIDDETGVEYVGKYYGGSLYYVPTGNVYPPNN